MKHLIASMLVVAAGAWVCAEEPSKRRDVRDGYPPAQRPGIPSPVPPRPRLPGREHLERGLIDDRPQAREAVEARRRRKADEEAGAAPAEENDAAAWRAVSAALGKAGEWKGGVYGLVFLRDDLEVTVEGNAVPAAAGIASEFRFYRCECGRINVMGQFVVADYEANDVVDALREGQIKVTSVGPLLLHEKPRLLLVRFFGENNSGGALARTLRAALSWTGKERMAPQKIE